MTDHDAQLGYDAAPERYAGARETIDLIRDALGSGFRDYCLGQVIRYRSRAGRKGPAEVDESKARFYERMVLHLDGNGPDPRAYRAGFAPYKAPEPEGASHDL